MALFKLIRKEYKCENMTLSNGLKCTIDNISLDMYGKVQRLEGGSISNSTEGITPNSLTFRCYRMDNGQFNKSVNGWIDGDFATLLDEIVAIIEGEIE